MANYKNIIFDLGNVIINIDFQLTYEAFAKLGDTDILSVLKKFEEQKVFIRFEKGEMSAEEMRNLVRKEFNKPSLTDKDIDDAWNALLLDIPEERIDLLLALRGKYKLYLLSNTNITHIKEVNKILFKTSGFSKLNDLFDEVFYSYEMGLIKPDKEIYEAVLQKRKLKAADCIFLDDNLHNVQGAESVGIRSVQVTKDYSVIDILKDY